MPNLEALQSSFDRILIEKLQEIKQTIQKGYYHKVYGKIDRLIKTIEEDGSQRILLGESEVTEIAVDEYTCNDPKKILPSIEDNQ